MNTIFKIAKAEWRNLFYSPVAWLVLLSFCIVCGVKFAIPLESYFRFQVFNLEVDAAWSGYKVHGLTAMLIGTPSGQLAKLFFLFIPLLTMGVMNREVTNGTIKLLYSSPIRVRDMVIGKYLGLISFLLLLIFFVTTIFAIIPTLITEADTTPYVSMVLGLFLLASTYVAIGIFISSITTYQIVAGVLTFIVFFILSAIENLWQQYDFIRDLTYFLNINGRFYNFLNGLITSRDVCYFILITLLFLGFTLIKLKSTQESKSWTVSFKRYALLSVAVLLVGYFTSIPGKVLYWDTTDRQINTIHPETQAVINEMDGSPLTITLYTNLFGKNEKEGFPQNRNFYIWQLWDKYRRFYPNMVLKYEYYYDVKDGDQSLYRKYPGMNLEQIRDKVAKEFGISASLFKGPKEIREIIDFKEERMQLVMRLEYKGKAAWLRTFEGGNWHTESTFCGSIKRLTRETPKIYFTTGNYERSPVKRGGREYLDHTTSPGNRNSLLNFGVDCDTISLSDRDIPTNCAILVVADPRSKLPKEEEQKINNYINNGGNALILGEPNKTENVNPLLAPIGIELEKGIIVNTNKDEMPHIFPAIITNAGAFMSGESAMYLYRLYKKDTPVVKIVGAANISYNKVDEFKVEPILEVKGDSSKWIECQHLVVDSAAPVFSLLAGDKRKDKYDIVVKVNRRKNDKEQRIVVAADADLLSFERMGVQGLSYYSWLLYNKYPTYINRIMPNDRYLQSNSTTIKAVSWTYSYVIPVLIIVTGIIVLVRRKRK